MVLEGRIWTAEKLGPDQCTEAERCQKTTGPGLISDVDAFVNFYLGISRSKLPIEEKEWWEKDREAKRQAAEDARQERVRALAEKALLRSVAVVADEDLDKSKADLRREAREHLEGLAKGKSPRGRGPNGKGKGKGSDTDSDDSYKYGRQINKGRFGKMQKGSPRNRSNAFDDTGGETSGPKKLIIRGAKQHERRNMSAERREQRRTRANTQAKPLDHSGKIVWRPAKAAHSVPLGESRSKRQIAQAPKAGQAAKNAGAAAEKQPAAPPARPSGPQWKGGGGTGGRRRASSASQTTDPRPSDAQAPRFLQLNLPMPRFAKSS